MALDIALPPDANHAPQWPDAPWMPHALGELGQRELPGGADNPRVLEYLATCTHNPALLHDETAWCSAFANWCMEQASVARTHKLNARSWLTWGRETVAPFKGCVVVFSRPPDPSHGHVGFWMGASGTDVLTLGGNENNAVSIKLYPASRLLCYRQAA